MYVSGVYVAEHNCDIEYCCKQVKVLRNTISCAYLQPGCFQRHQSHDDGDESGLVKFEVEQAICLCGATPRNCGTQAQYHPHHLHDEHNQQAFQTGSYK